MESYTNTRPWSGNLFRWDAGSNRWLFNLDLSKAGMKANTCYRVDVNYGGTVRNGIASGGTPAGSFLVLAIR